MPYMITFTISIPHFCYHLWHTWILWELGAARETGGLPPMPPPMFPPPTTTLSPAARDSGSGDGGG